MSTPKLESIKNDLIRSLGLAPDEILQLEKHFYSVEEEVVTRGWSFSTFCLCMFFICVTASASSLSLFAVTLSLVLIYQIHLRLTYQNRKKEAISRYELKLAEKLSNCVSSWLEKNYFDGLKANILNLNFKSLRELNCSITHRVHFNSLEETFSRGLILENYDRRIRLAGNKSANFQLLYYELTPEISFCVEELFISMKCDFRIIRNEFQQPEIVSIFKKCVESIPFLSASQIRIRQWSSTKDFVFGKNDLNEEALLYLEKKQRKPRAKRATYSDRSYANFARTAYRRKDKTSAEPPSLYERAINTSNNSQTPFSKNFEASDYPQADSEAQYGIPESVEVILNAMEKKKRSELTAMNISEKFEIFQGRSPTDVSSQGLGYDIESIAQNSDKLHIEVKGFDTTGDVLLTSNEVRAAESHGDSYFVYVAENCSKTNSQTLLRVKGVKKADLQERVLNFGFSLKEQNCQNLIKVAIEN